MSVAARSSHGGRMARGISFRMPPESAQIFLPVLSYATLAGAVVATLHVMQPFAGVGVAMTGFSVGLPVAMVLGELALMGGSGVAKSLGGVETSDAHLQCLATNAAAAVGVSTPRIFELRAKEPNAFAASGLRGHDTTVAITSGLREILTADELSAVLAHEMGHLRHRDMVRNIHIVAAAAGLGGIYQLGRAIYEAEMEEARKERREDEEKACSALPLAMGLMAGGLMLEGSAHLLRLSASRNSEIRADRAAAEAYGAQTVIDALTKIDKAVVRRPADLRGGTGKAYAFTMISDGSTATMTRHVLLGPVMGALRTHPTLEQRVMALKVAAADGLVPSCPPSRRTLRHESWRMRWVCKPTFSMITGIASVATGTAARFASAGSTTASWMLNENGHVRGTRPVAA